MSPYQEILNDPSFTFIYMLPFLHRKERPSYYVQGFIISIGFWLFLGTAESADFPLMVVYSFLWSRAVCLHVHTYTQPLLDKGSMVVMWFRVR